LVKEDRNGVKLSQKVRDRENQRKGGREKVDREK
jgi:hypothetical protein